MRQGGILKTPTFTIIISVLNGIGVIHRCLASILSQNCTSYEIIIIDGGSTDGTVDILREYDSRLAYWVSEPDNGIYHAWNKAFLHANGEWLLYLGADDALFNDDVLQKAETLLTKLEPVYQIAYAKVAITEENDRIVQYKGDSWDKLEHGFWHTMNLPHQGVFHRRSVLDEFGPFNESFRIAADYDLLLKALKKHQPFYLGNLVIARWGTGGVSYHVATALKVAAEFSMARKINGLGRISLPLAIFYTKALILEALFKIGGERFANAVARKWRNLKGEWQA